MADNENTSVTKDLGIVSAYGYAKAAGYTGTEEEFEQIFLEFTEDAPGLLDRLDEAVSDCEDAASDAADAKTAAENAQTAAEAAAATFETDTTLAVSGKAADAKVTGDEITGLKTAINQINEPSFSFLSNAEISKEKGGFSGDVGSALELTTTSNYIRGHFKPIPGRTYRFTYTTRANLSINAAYIKTVDANGIVLEDLDIRSPQTPSEQIISTHTFNSNVAYVWSRGREYYTFTIEEETTRIDKLEDAFNYDTEYYNCKIPESNDYSNSTFNDVYDAYDALCTAYPKYITKETNLGNDAAGNPINHYVVTKNKGKVRTLDDSTNLIDTYCPLKRILLSAGVHGDEKSGAWGLYNFVRDYVIANTLWENRIENNYIFDVIPLINPWGYDNNSRVNYNNVDINRDYQSNTPQPETSAVLGLISSFNGDLFASIDSHSTNGPNNYIATRSYNVIVSAIMKLATDTINSCASRWGEISAILGYSNSSYPWGVGILSSHDGTIVDYLIDAGITNIAMTVESLKETGGKIGIASKINADFIGNLIIGMINNSTLQQ